MTIKKLLLSLQEHKVRFLVIGAWALPAHGYVRNTTDIDFFIEPTKQNAKRVMKALVAVGYDVVRDATIETFLTKKVLLREYVLQTDTHPFVKGITFKDAWKNKIETKIEGVTVSIPSLDDMIAMKEAANREKDKLDLIELYRIRDTKNNTNKVKH